MSKDNNFGILGFVAGAAIGAALGVLFAPRSGKETRELIASKARGTKDDVDELIEKGRAEWSKAKGKAADTATMTKEEVSDFVRFLFKEGANLKDRVGQDVRNSVDDVKERAQRAAEHIRHGAN